VTALLNQTLPYPLLQLKKFGAKKGAWAIVTGATDGIGKEFALQLGKAGFNVLLVARNQTLLTSVAGEIGEFALVSISRYIEVFAEQKYKVSTVTHSIDYGKAGDAECAALASVVGDLDVGVLVNNVGKSHSMPAYLTDTPQDEITDIISININGTIRTTYAVLPGMVQRY
jgi:short-subunit dehydrogenase